MRANILIAFFAVALASCTSPNAAPPMRIKAGGTGKVPREAAFALLPEPDMRIQKVLFYDRLGNYLRRSGLKITSPEQAEFLIQVLIENSSSELMQIISRPAHPQTTNKEDTSVFIVLVYPAGDEKLIDAASRRDLPAIMRGQVWMAVTAAPTLFFRLYEEEIVDALFTHLGANYDGPIVNPKRANSESSAARLP